MRFWTSAVVTMVLVAAGSTVEASLVVNGTFDSDLSGWSTAGTTTGVVQQDGVARVGQPGTPGLAVLSQSFDIPAGAAQLAVDFDYEWQVERPTANEDFFKAVLSYVSGSGTQMIELLNESSDDGTFGPPAVSFSTVVSLVDLVAGPGNGTISFSLEENNSPVGTRVHLDNVAVNVVPEASALVTWSALLAAGLLVGRKCLAA